MAGDTGSWYCININFVRSTAGKKIVSIWWKKTRIRASISNIFVNVFNFNIVILLNVELPYVCSAPWFVGYQTIIHWNKSLSFVILLMMAHFHLWIEVIVMVFNVTFHNISVSFIGGGNRGTRRKPTTCRKSLTNLIT